MLNIRLLAGGAMAILLVMAACSGDDESKGGGQAKSFPDSVVDEELLATVNSRPISGRDLRVFTMVYQSGTSDSLRSGSFNEKILDGLIDRTLLLQEAEAVGVTIDDSTHKWYLREFSRAVGGEETMEKLLAAGGFTRHEMEQLVKQDLTIRKFLESSVAAPVDVPDSLGLAYYRQNESQFWTPDSVRARHIIIRRSQDDTDLDIQAKSQTLRDLRDRAMAGEDFAELAKQYSEGPSAPRGGDLGYFTARDMVATFANSAFDLEPGGISDVVETSFGYHIIQVIDKKPRRKLPYEEISEQLKQQIAQFHIEQTLQNHLQRSRAVAIIEKKY